MYKLVLIFILLLSSSTLSQDYLSPGSYTIEYGGLYKMAASETNKFFSNRWREQQEELYEGGVTTFGDFSREQRSINNFMQDWRFGSPWWTRSWWDSLTIKNGGAVANHSIRIRHGKTFPVFETPVFTIFNSFEFKWKSIKASVDFDADRAFAFGEASMPPRAGWQFQVEPAVSIASRALLGDIVRSIKSVGVVVSAIHTVRSIPIVSIAMTAYYESTENAFVFGVEMRFLQW